MSPQEPAIIKYKVRLRFFAPFIFEDFVFANSALEAVKIAKEILKDKRTDAKDLKFDEEEVVVSRGI